MLEQAILDGIIAEWWSGMDAHGGESKLARWRDHGGLVGRQRVLEVEDLCALICRAWVGNNRVSARLAFGADGRPDVRVELTDAKGKTKLHRWRPVDGQWSALTCRGAPLERTHGERALYQRKADAMIASGLDHETANLGDTTLAIEAIKRRRVDLVDMAEAGHPTASGALAELESHHARIRGRHNALHLRRKLAVVAEDA